MSKHKQEPAGDWVQDMRDHAKAERALDIKNSSLLRLFYSKLPQNSLLSNTIKPIFCFFFFVFPCQFLALANDSGLFAPIFHNFYGHAIMGLNCTPLLARGRK